MSAERIYLKDTANPNEPRAWESIAGAGLVTTALAPTAQIIPKIGGTATGRIIIDAAALNAVIVARATVNATDDANAANRLATTLQDVYPLNLGESLRITSDTAITTCYIIGHATSDDSGAYSAPTARTLLASNVTEASYITTAVKFDFDVADNVRVVELTLSNGHTDGTTDKNIAVLNIAGYSP